MKKLNIDKQIVGSCNCMVKTPGWAEHDELCYFRLLMENQETTEADVRLNNLLNAIKDSEEVCMLSGEEDNGGATEDRFRIEIAGPERLLKPLSDILFKGI